MDTLNARLQLKHDTDSNWELVENTFVPLAGEGIYYTTTSRLKIGDGTTVLRDLDFIGSSVARFG